jgi:hypothetical protein
LQPNNFIEFLAAAVDTRYINGPFPERGGIMIIGPPGSFKTTMIETAIEDNPEAMLCSNLNAKQWAQIRGDFINKTKTCIALGEFELLYKRNMATAQMCEGIFHQLAAEGNIGGPMTDPTMQRSKARALVIGGITESCYERRFRDWKESGFARRFLWMLVHVDDPTKVLTAIREWKRLDFGQVYMKPANRVIEMELTKDESLFCEKLLKTQPGLHGTGYILLKKIFAVLKFKYKKAPEKALAILKDVAPALSKSGAELELP